MRSNLICKGKYYVPVMAHYFAGMGRSKHLGVPPTALVGIGLTDLPKIGGRLVIPGGAGTPSFWQII